MQTREHLLAVVEPTAGGEATLALANELVARGGKATVALVVTDGVREGFRHYADAENLGEGHAEAVAVSRLMDVYRARVGGDDTGAIVTESATSSGDLLDAATGTGVTSIAIPQHLATERDLHGLMSESLVPVVVAPAS